jgi:hypothetical protein
VTAPSSRLPGERCVVGAMWARDGRAVRPGQGIWWSSGAGGWIELVINLLTVALSALLLRWTWLHRRAVRFGE